YGLIGSPYNLTHIHVKAQKGELSHFLHRLAEVEIIRRPGTKFSDLAGIDNRFGDSCNSLSQNFCESAPSTPPTTTGLVGLSLSYAFALTGMQVFLSRWYSSLANYIVSVERIKQYMNIPPEPLAVIPDNRPPASWPQKGRIELLELKIMLQ
ncbi:ABC transporter C family member 10-like, partial [Salvia splendens]|uniref:ABC transporter C family member 10-like n=1 Tax=Salvia splendens TaxID=180675 RepID=UPI001C27F31F